MAQEMGRDYIEIGLVSDLQSRGLALVCNSWYLVELHWTVKLHHVFSVLVLIFT